MLRPSLFFQDMTRRHFAPQIRQASQFFQLGKFSNSSSGVYEDSYRIAQVDAKDIADVAACCLAEGVSRHAGNTYVLNGPKALSWEDIAASISGAVGRTVKAVMLSDVEFYKQFGDSHVYLKQMQAYRAGASEDVDGDIEIITGTPARSFVDFALAHKADWAT